MLEHPSQVKPSNGEYIFLSWNRWSGCWVIQLKRVWGNVWVSRGNINKDFAERTGDLRAGAALRCSAAGKEKVETGSLQPPSHRLKKTLSQCPSPLAGLSRPGLCGWLWVFIFLWNLKDSKHGVKEQYTPKHKSSQFYSPIIKNTTEETCPTQSSFQIYLKRSFISPFLNLLCGVVPTLLMWLFFFSFWKHVCSFVSHSAEFFCDTW